MPLRKHKKNIFVLIMYGSAVELFEVLVYTFYDACILVPLYIYSTIVLPCYTLTLRWYHHSTPYCMGIDHVNIIPCRCWLLLNIRLPCFWDMYNGITMLFFKAPLMVFNPNSHFTFFIGFLINTLQTHNQWSQTINSLSFILINGVWQVLLLLLSSSQN